MNNLGSFKLGHTLVKVQLFSGFDLTDPAVTVKGVHYEKEDGTTGVLNGVAMADGQTVEMQMPADRGPFTEPGKYILRAYVEKGGRFGYGDPNILHIVP